MKYNSFLKSDHNIFNIKLIHNNIDNSVYRNDQKDYIENYIKSDIVLPNKYFYCANIFKRLLSILKYLENVDKQWNKKIYDYGFFNTKLKNEKDMEIQQSYKFLKHDKDFFNNFITNNTKKEYDKKLLDIYEKIINLNICVITGDKFLEYLKLINTGNELTLQQCLEFSLYFNSYIFCFLTNNIDADDIIMQKQRIDFINNL